MHAGNERRYGVNHMSFLKYMEISYNGYMILLDKHKIIKVSAQLSDDIMFIIIKPITKQKIKVFKSIIKLYNLFILR